MKTLLLPSTLGRIALPGWRFPRHIQALQRAVLDLLYDPDRNRLIVEIPVRHGKSYYCSYVLPAWYIMTHPHRNAMVVSYGDEFATEWSHKVRDLVEYWGPAVTGVRLDRSQKSKHHFRLAHPATGELRGLGIGGALAGKGAHLIICDDLVKEFSEVATEEARQALYDRFHGELLTRLEPGGKIIIVMSRRHPDDLSGRLLASNDSLEPSEQWHRIRFPALNEFGRALWPERYPAKKLKAIRRDHEIAGTLWQWHSLYEQNPTTAAELCEWPRSYWDDIFFSKLPDNLRIRHRLMAVDASMGADRHPADYSAILLGLADARGRLWIVDARMLREPLESVEDLAVAMIRVSRPDAVRIETGKGQLSIAQEIQRKAGDGIPIYAAESTIGPEVAIRMILSPLLAAGKLKVLDSPHGRILANQLRDFPLASHNEGPRALVLLAQLLHDLRNPPLAGGNVAIITR